MPISEENTTRSQRRQTHNRARVLSLLSREMSRLVKPMGTEGRAGDGERGVGRGPSAGARCSPGPGDVSEPERWWHGTGEVLNAPELRT